jgi:hypothetical protein
MSQQPPGNPPGGRPASRPDPARGGRDYDATQPLPPRPDLAGPPGAGYMPDRPSRPPAQREPDPAFDPPWVDESAGGPSRPNEPESVRPARRPVRHAPEPPPDPLDPFAWDLEATEATAVESAPARDDWEDEPEPPEVPVRRVPAARRAPARSGARVRAPQVRVPSGLVDNDLTADPLSLGLLGINLASVVLMALVFATQAGKLPPTFVQHLDAAGLPDRWGSARVLWRIPLLALGVTAMNTVLAWFLARRDRFASRFVLAAALFVQIIAWIALFDFI